MPSPLVLQPDATEGKDCWHRLPLPTVNLGTSQLINTTFASQWGFFQFDLSSLSGVTVTTAQFDIYYYEEAGSNNNREHRAYRMIQAWTEGTKNGSGTADGLTWNTYDGTNAWGTAGGENTTTDREAAACSDVFTINNFEAAGWKTLNFTASKVQEWVDGTFTNNGFVLRPDTANGGCSFRSSDYTTDTSQRPKLTVTYTEGVPYIPSFDLLRKVGIGSDKNFTGTGAQYPHRSAGRSIPFSGKGQW